MGGWGNEESFSDYTTVLCALRIKTQARHWNRFFISFQVNVSRNVLVDLEQLGLSHRGDFKCNVTVERLVVTDNGLRTVTPGKRHYLLDTDQGYTGSLLIHQVM